MLKWLTFISLVLTFFVGVLSALFKTVRDREGTSLEGNKHSGKLPVLTGWGWALLIGLFTLCLLSIGLVVGSSRQAEESETRSEATRQELTNQLAELRKDNEDLRSGNHLLQTGNNELRKLADLNFQELVDSQEDANKKHSQSLDRFSALITRQEDIGRNTAPRIDRVSFVLAFPGEQKIAAAFLRRLHDRPMPRGPRLELIEGAEPMLLTPGTELFPNPNNEKEDGLYEFLSHVRLNLRFFKDPPKVEFAGIGHFYRFQNDAAFRAVADASIMPSRINNFAEKPAEGQTVEARYDGIRNRILLEAYGISNLYKSLTTWDELAGYYVLVDLDPLITDDVILATKVSVASLTLISSIDSRIEVLNFKPFYPEELTFTYVARIPPQAKWDR